MENVTMVDNEYLQMKSTLAIKEYLNTQENLRSLTKVGEKYGVKR